jgi:transcription antitermination protein NusB
MKSSRRRARELALQGLYQWQLAKHAAADILAQLSESNGFAKVDADYLRTLLEGVTGEPARLEALLAPALDRKFAELSPIERGLLMIGAYELACQPDTPYRVIINESIELAKTFGGTDGHKYVNGVLDKLAHELRAAEVLERSGARTAG